jgi:hypothetical protein
MGIGEPFGSLLYLCADDRWTTLLEEPSPGPISPDARFRWLRWRWN